MQFNNNQSGYPKFIPAYGNLSSATPYFYQQPEAPATTNLIASAIPDDSLLYDMYDYQPSVNHAVASTGGTPIIPNNPSSFPMSPSPALDQETGTTADVVDKKRPKRKQVKNACVNCQKACKKCDDGRPCQRCIKLGLTATCTNSARKERKKGVKRGPYKKRQHFDGARESSKLSDWDESSCSEFVPYGASEVPSMYQTHYQVSPLSMQASPLSSSPLSSDASFSYLPYGTSATMAADTSSVSGASLSPLSSHFPNNSWEDYQDLYSAVQHPATASHLPIDVHQSYHHPSTMVDNLGYDVPFQFPTQPVYTTKHEEQDYLYPPQTTSMVPVTVPSMSPYTYLSYTEEQQQQQPFQYQMPLTGYW